MRSDELYRVSTGAIEMILWASCFVTIVIVTNEYLDIAYADRVMEALGIL